jgi:hypothetical protein
MTNAAVKSRTVSYCSRCTTARDPGALFVCQLALTSAQIHRLEARTNFALQVTSKRWSRFTGMAAGGSGASRLRAKPAIKMSCPATSGGLRYSGDCRQPVRSTRVPNWCALSRCPREQGRSGWRDAHLRAPLTPFEKSVRRSSWRAKMPSSNFQVRDGPGRAAWPRRSERPARWFHPTGGRDRLLGASAMAACRYETPVVTRSGTSGEQAGAVFSRGVDQPNRPPGSVELTSQRPSTSEDPRRIAAWSVTRARPPPRSSRRSAFRAVETRRRAR